MASKRNVGLIVGVGGLGVIAGLALIFANQPVGRAVMFASTVGASIALTRPPAGDVERDREAWFGPKRMGFGWGPRNWKGYALVVALLVILLFIGVYFAPPLKT